MKLSLPVVVSNKFHDQLEYIELQEVQEYYYY